MRDSDDWIAEPGNSDDEAEPLVAMNFGVQAMASLVGNRAIVGAPQLSSLTWCGHGTEGSVLGSTGNDRK